jgi:hypothetical protein
MTQLEALSHRYLSSPREVSHIRLVYAACSSKAVLAPFHSPIPLASFSSSFLPRPHRLFLFPSSCPSTTDRHPAVRMCFARKSVNFCSTKMTFPLAQRSPNVGGLFHEARKVILHCLTLPCSKPALNGPRNENMNGELLEVYHQLSVVDLTE